MSLWLFLFVIHRHTHTPTLLSDVPSKRNTIQSQRLYICQFLLILEEQLGSWKKLLLFLFVVILITRKPLQFIEQFLRQVNNSSQLMIYTTTLKFFLITFRSFNIYSTQYMHRIEEKQQVTRDQKFAEVKFLTLPLLNFFQIFCCLFCFFFSFDIIAEIMYTNDFGMYEFYIAPAIMPYCRAVMLMLCYFCMQMVETRTQKCKLL